MSSPDWPVETVEACLARIGFPSPVKLQTKDYRPEGAYPIVDQGQSLIAGWTDNQLGVISSPLPIIVFGDHTRAFKFIDFPFVRGADGTQLLKPRDDIDPLYFFYACRALDLPSRGYNRHFTILKEQSIALPPASEQAGIAGSLRRLEDSIEAQKRQSFASEELKRAAMSELFTHGSYGEAQKETELHLVPESWDSVPIGALGSVVTGTTPPTKDPDNYTSGDIPFVAPGDIDHGTRIERAEKHITQRGLSLARPLPEGTTCFVCIGSTIGKVGLTTTPVCATNQQINAIIPSSEFDQGYVFHLMTHWSDHVRQQASPSPVPILSKGAFEQIRIYTTRDPEEQRKIASVLDVIDRKIDLHKRKRAILEELFKALLHGLMNGEIRFSDLGLPALQQTSTAEAAA